MCILLFAHPCFGEVLVNLDATGLSNGPLATWTNTGTISSNFTSAGTVVPQVTTVAGVKGVVFLGGTTGPNGTHYIGPVAPPAVTGSSNRTVEAWIYNPSPQAEETIFAWGRRSEPPGSNCSFNHGTDPTFGAVGHWGAGPDIGWNGQIQFSRWTYVVYTYDGTAQTTTLYKDGQQANQEGGIVLNTLTTDTADNPLRMRVARQNGAGGGPSGVGVGEITIAKIRVHDTALDSATVAATFDAEHGAFGLADADNDGLPDGYEGQYPGCLNATNAADATADCDSDGLTNLQEFQAGTVPTNADTDGDGANDGAEVNRMNGGTAAPTNPLRADTDGDSLRDGAETDTGTFTSATNTGTDPLLPDTDADGFTDGHEVLRASNPTVNTSTPNLANVSPLVNLDATALPNGALPVWTNAGALGGVFNASAAVPAVTTIDDVKGVTFNGTTHFYTGPGAPSFITGTNGRTIEAWIYNPAAADEETIFAWARRGGPDGSNMSFNHGLNATFGAVGHWGAPDVGWGTNPPAVGRWTFVAYSYDPTTGIATVYKDGVFANSDTATLNTHFADNTPAANPLPFRVASQNEPDGAATAALRGSMTIARIKVYEVALDETAITNHFSAEADTFGLADNDRDGMPNGYERRYAFLNPDNPADAAMDQDSDTATNLEEYRAGTAPNVADSDGDGLNDGTELHRMDGGSSAPTNPLRRDSDQDGLADSVETDTGAFASATNTGSDPLNVDSDGDTFADGQEVFHVADPNLPASTPDFDFSAPVAIVNLDATDKPEGNFGMWTNSGALGGVFVSDAVGSVPQVHVVEGVKGVNFSGGADIFTGPVAPVFLTGNNSRTIEAWIFNPEVAPEENIFSWGRRGGPDGSNVSFNHGTDPAFGAVGHWGGGPDISWSGNISTGRWTFVAYTYDRPTMTVSVYRDGQLANTETGTTLNTHAVDNTPATNGLPFRVATQNEANGTATPGLRGSMTIARIRVYDEALSATGDDSIEAHYLAERSLFSGPALRVGIQFDRTAGRATLTWPASPGARYTVQSSSNLASWSSRATGLTTGSFVDDQAGTNPIQFYRILTE